MKRLVVIVGPTGSGKTTLSLHMASRWQCPIINADSRQIYRDLPIGTAAPSEHERTIVTHYMILDKELTESYNAGQFARDTQQLLTTLYHDHDVVIMVGGSMLYVEAVCFGLDSIPSVPHPIRQSVQHDYATLGLTWLQTQVKQHDPAYWSTVDTSNPQRLMHCLEVCLTTGQPYSSFRTQSRQQNNAFEVEWHLIDPPRASLYAHINERVDQMIAAGLEQEARQAFTSLDIDMSASAIDTSPLPNSINTVGYREMLNYFRGIWTREKAIEMIKQNTRHYAKRQMTWWRNRL